MTFFSRDKFDKSEADLFAADVAPDLEATKDELSLTPAPSPAPKPAGGGFQLPEITLPSWEDLAGPVEQVRKTAADAIGNAGSAIGSQLPSVTLPSWEDLTGQPAAKPANNMTPAGTIPSGGQPVAIPQGEPTGDFPIDRSSPQAFLGSFRPAAEAALQAHGLPASLAPILAAIPMNEQGWQAEAPGNNYFGIKGSNPKTGANTGPVGTWEDYGNGRQNIQDTFRAYGSPAESVSDFLSFLEDNPRYAKALDVARQTGDPSAFIHAVHDAGYATDPKWADKILSIAGQVPATPAQPSTVPVPATNGQSSAPSRGGMDIGGLAQRYAGGSYVYGGGRDGQGGVPGDPDSDCSAFVSAVWREQGLPLVAHTDGAYNQLRQLGAQQVGEADARPGDVVFYMGAGSGGEITHHMGIYAGPGQVLDQSIANGGGVKTRPLDHGGAYVILRDPRMAARSTADDTVGQQQGTPGNTQPEPIAAPVRQMPYDSRGADSGPREAGYRQPPTPGEPSYRLPLGQQSLFSDDQQPSDADQGPHEATPGSVGAGPVGPLYGPEPAETSQPASRQTAAEPETMATDAAPAPFSPYGPSTDPVADAVRRTAPEASPADVSPAAPSSTMLPVWDENGQVVGYRQQSPQTRANVRQSAGRGAVQSAPGEPDYVPPASSVFSEGGIFEPASGVPRLSERMRQIEANAAQEQGIGADPVRSITAPLDPGWRARNPEAAAEYDDLQTQLALVVAGQAGDSPSVLGRAGKELRAAATDAVAPLARGLSREAEDALRALERAGAQPDVIATARRSFEEAASTPRAAAGDIPSPSPLESTGRETPAQASEQVRGSSSATSPEVANPEPPTQHDYSSTQLDLPKPIADRVIAFGRKIPDSALAEGGREADVHVTAKYGLETADPEEVRSLVEGHGPITVKLGKTSVFPASETGGTFDVVKVDVDSPQLHALNAKLSELPNGDTHPEYVPHVTVAYVQPGMGARYAGSRALDGKTATIDALTFSGKDGQQVSIPLLGNGKEAVVATDRLNAEAKSIEQAARPSTEGTPAAMEGSALPSMAQAGQSGSLYHETDPREAVSIAAGMMDKRGLNVARDPSFALGQGGRGAVVEMSDEGVELRPGRAKPGAAMMEATGQGAPEYEIVSAPYDGSKIARSITFDAGFKRGSLPARRLRNLGWQEERLGDGRVRYSNPRLGTATPETSQPPTPATPPQETPNVPVPARSVQPAPVAERGMGGGPSVPESTPAVLPPVVPPAVVPPVVPPASGRFGGPPPPEGPPAPPTPPTGPNPPGPPTGSTRVEGALALAGDRTGGRSRPQRDIPGQQPINMTPEQEVGRLRLDKFPEEVRADIEAAARGQDWARAQRRGVLSDEVVQRMAQDDAASVDQLIKGGRAGRAYNAEETLAVRNAVASQANVVRDLSEQIAEARAAGHAPELLVARRAAEATKLSGLVQVAEGARAEAGRTLRAYRQQANLIELNPNEAVERIYRRLGGRDNAGAAVDEYTRMVEDGANPIQLAKFWAKVEAGKITGADLFGLYRRFNMLSGPRTIEVNALSGAVNLGYEVLGAAAGQVARLRGREAVAEVAAPFKASSRAFTNLAETMYHGVSTEQAARGDIPRTLSSRTDNPVARGALTVLEAPDRFNAGVDQFFRTMTEDWAATRLANQQAREAGLTPRSKTWADTVAANTEAIRDDPSKFPQIKKMADHVTFSEEPGAAGKGLEAFRQKAPLVANLLFPFIRTPYNIASRAIDLSPIGIVRTGVEAATGAGRGAENLAPRVRDNVIGTAAAVWAYDQAQQGNVTGAGPDDPEKLAELRATGWQPYSVKIGDQYWSYANFAPFSLALSSGAAAAEAQRYAKPGKSDALSMLSDGAARTAKVVTDMTVLAGIGAVIKSIQDPDRYGTQWLTQFLQTLIPAGSALNTIGQATDPLIRRSERTDVGTQITQNLEARLPGLRESVPAAQDPLGRPVRNEQTGLGALNPFRPTTERPDPAIQAFIDAGVDIGAPRTKITMGGAKLDLTPAEQRRWNNARGEQLARMVAPIVAGGGLDRMPPEAREKTLRAFLDAAASVADARVFGEMTGQDRQRRITDGLTKKAS